MANLRFDFSANNIFKNAENIKTYKYKDIGTSNFGLIHNNDGSITLSDKNTANYDMAAIRASLDNLFNFRLGQAILEPMYRK